MLTAKYLKTLEMEDVENIQVEDIRNAYERLKKLYSGNSIVIESMDDDINDRDREQILLEIEEAQSYLMGLFEGKTEEKEEERFEEKEEEQILIEQVDRVVFNEPVEVNSEAVSPVYEEQLTGDLEDLKVNESDSATGDLIIENFVHELEQKEDSEDEIPEITYEQNELEVVSIETPEVSEEIAVSQEEPISVTAPLSDVNHHEMEENKEETKADAEPVLNIFNIFRENVGFTLEEISDYTNIPVDVLSNIESERFESFPDSGYLRWCVNTYAKVLELELPKTADDYMKSYRQWQRDRG